MSEKVSYYDEKIDLKREESYLEKQNDVKKVEGYFGKRMKALLPFAIGALVVLAGLVAYFLYRNNSSLPVVSVGNTGTVGSTGGASGPPKISKERVFFQRDLFPGLFSIQSDGSDLKSLLKTSEYIQDLIVSKSRNKVGFMIFDDVVIMNAKTDEIELRQNFHGRLCDISHDDTKILIEAYSDEILIVDISTKSVEKFALSPEHNTPRYIHFSPTDEKTIIYNFFDYTAKKLSMFSWNIETGEVKELFELPQDGYSFVFKGENQIAFVKVNLKDGGSNLHIVDIEKSNEGKVDNEMIFPVTTGTINSLSWPSDNHVYLSIQAINSKHNDIYKFDIKEKSLTKIEKDNNVNFEDDKVADAPDGKVYFVKSDKLCDNLLSYDGSKVENVFDNSIANYSQISEIVELSSSKLMFKANYLVQYDISSGKFENIISPAPYMFKVSPSGRRVAIYEQKKPKFEVFDVVEKTLVFSKDIPDIAIFTFSPDCKFIYYICQTGATHKLYKMDSQTGKYVEEIIEMDGDEYTKRLLVSPDGANIAFVKGDKTAGTSSLMILPSDKVLKTLYTSGRNSFSIISWAANSDTIYLEVSCPSGGTDYCLYSVNVSDRNMIQAFNSDGTEIKIKKI